MPPRVGQSRGQKLFDRVLEHGIDPADRARINYFNALEHGTALGDAPMISELPRSHSFYYHDFQMDSETFDRNLRVHTLFGDIIHVPGVPSIVKSRPIGSGNANSVVMKLDRLRHFFIRHDPVPFDRKRPHAVWRGGIHNKKRKKLVEVHGARTDHNIGQTGKAYNGITPKHYLSPREQFAYRYILSVEGVDVATNTKWAMWSNSVCVMPKPRFETWFMEGTLKPYVHYVPVEDDFSDLDERIDWCESNQQEARQIVANARAYVAGFLNPSREALVTWLVLRKYFERTGQLEPAPFSADIFD